MEKAGKLVALDWGTSNARAYLMSGDGRILDEKERPAGIMQVDPTDYPDALEEMLQALSGRDCPIIAGGMITSQQGWCETPYMPCPAGREDLIAGLRHLRTAKGSDVTFVPGLSDRQDLSRPDVMRGEECQIFGAFGSDESGTAILPGTHSKWIRVERGRIAGFRTYMTGEVFDLMAHHSILGRLADRNGEDGEAFDKGVGRGLEGDLLGDLFSARSLALFKELAPAGVESYLSGLLIGAEIAAGRNTFPEAAQETVRVIAGAALTARYRHALDLAGIDNDVVAGRPAAAGLFAVARAARLID